MPQLQEITATEYKAIDNGQINVDEAQGIVECFVAGLGNKDGVGDICAPGCFTESLKRRKPRVVWGHNWNEPIGKVIEIYEVNPNDPRLPMKMKRAGIGGLYARVQFNLKSERGKQAFLDISFFGTEQEWSIGYKTLDAEYDSSRQANILKEVELYEVSPVLHGANQLTGTISIKHAQTQPSVKIYEADNNEADYSGPRGEDGGVPAMNPAMGRMANLSRALATRFGGAVRVRSAEENMVIFDHKKGNEEPTTMRVTYHFDGDEFMFGTPVAVRPQMVYLPANENEAGKNPAANHNEGQNPYESNYDMDKNPMVPEGVKPKYEACKCGCMSGKESSELGEVEEEVKAPIPPDALPQERVTGDVMRGYGPRRGNLEALLKYWRPIMKKPGGFRRCKVILADHPELYPLNNICAWLHHETTGLWPNEGCHHPGMKNCRNKIRGVSNGSIWNDSEWSARLDKIPDGKTMGLGEGEDDLSGVPPQEVEEKAMMYLKEFLDAQPEFVKFIGEKSNWEHYGESDDESKGRTLVVHIRRNDDDDDHGDCGCGCGGAGSCGTDKPAIGMIQAMTALEKSLSYEMETKAGRVLNNRNLKKLKDMLVMLQEVISSAGGVEVEVKYDSATISLAIDEMFEVKSLIDPVLEYHNIHSYIDDEGIHLSGLTTSATEAINAAVNGYKSING
jgi:HK97 family phage prohead protease